MRMNRRLAMSWVASGTTALCSPLLLAQPATYPVRPVRVIVATPAGGGLDSVARPIFAKLQERMGNPFVIENRGGATVAVDAVSRSNPDGYTLLVAGNTTFFAAEQIVKVPYDVRTKFVPVAAMITTPLVVLVNIDLPIKSMTELISYAKAHPKLLNYAFLSGGSASQLAGELLKLQTGITMEGIGFKGVGPAYIEQMAGRVHVTFGSMSSAMPLVQAGKLRAIAVTTGARSPLLPDVPTIRETLPSFDVFESQAFVHAVEGTPPAIVAILNREINAVLTMPELSKLMATLGAQPTPGTPEQLQQSLVAGLDSARRIIKLANIRSE